MRKIDSIIKNCLAVLAGAGICYLTLLSALGTSVVGSRNFASELEKEDWGLYNFFFPDKISFHIGIILFVLAVAYLTVEYVLPHISVRWKNKVKICLAIVFLVCGSWFVLTLRLEATSDSWKILRIAEQMVAGEYEGFQKNTGYLWRYPDQLGIIFLYYLITLGFGEWNCEVIQLLNVVATAMMGYYAGKIYELLWGCEGWGAVVVELLYYLFAPLLFYTTYMYGTILGVAFSVFAIFYELKFLNEYKKIDALKAAVLIALAVIFKTNSMIMLTAMILFLLYSFFLEKKKKLCFMGIVLLLITQMVATQGLHLYMGGKAGEEISKGMPKLCWVAMALQDNRLAPGTWNGYSVHLYEEAGYDYNEANRMAIEKIFDRLEEFDHDKSEALRLIGRKMAYQWNDPLWGTNEKIRGRTGREPFPEWYVNMSYGRNYYNIFIFCNYMQTLILAGSLFCLIFGGCRLRRESMILYTAFLGGFIFHIFWEAKPEYVFPYFLLLFPYCVRGYSLAVRKIDNTIRRKEKIYNKKILQLMFLTILFFAVLSQTRLLQYTVAVQDEPKLYLPYLEEVQIDLLQ